MTAGRILKTALLQVEDYTVKENEDIELGELVCDDGSGNGLVAATAALAVTQKVMMALKAHDYSEESYHKIPCVIIGSVTVQKATGTAIAKNDKVIVSATAGEATVFVAGDAPTGGVSTYYTSTIETNVQAAMDKNAGIIATCLTAAGSSDTTVDIALGVY